MILESLGMLGLGFLVGLTGAMVPGPTLIATVNSVLKGGWTAGPRVVLGHMAVELALMLVSIAGISIVIGNYAWVVAAAGGIALVVFGVLTLREARTAVIPLTVREVPASGPVLAGMVTSISNPYFWIWWFTIGSALLLGAYEGGVVLALLFIIGHWSADLSWYTLVSAGVHRGRFFLGQKEYRWTLGFCGAFLIVFGGYFLATSPSLSVNAK